MLLVSHSMEDIAKYANRVLVMSNKKIAMYDTVEKRLCPRSGAAGAGAFRAAGDEDSLSCGRWVWMCPLMCTPSPMRSR